MPSSRNVTKSAESKSTDPPLTLPEVDFGSDPLPDLAQRLREIEARGERVVRVRFMGGDAWLVLGYDNVAGVLKNDEEIPAGPHYQEVMSTAGRTVLQMEGEEHHAYKAVMLRWFSPKRVEQLTEEVVLPVIDRIIDEFGDQRSVRLTDTFTQRLGFDVMSRLIGMPAGGEAEREIKRVITDMNQMLDPDASLEAREQNAREGIEKANAILRPVLEERKRRREDDFISYLIDLEVLGKTFTDDEILNWARLAYVAGADSTGFQIGNVLAAILSRPELQELMLKDMASRTPVIDELMRLEGASGLVVRRAVKDTPVGGVTIPSGAHILLGFPSANRDPEQFDEPEEIRFDRKNKGQSVTFGKGAHFCLGHNLAKAEVHEAVHHLLDRLPGLRLAGPPSRPIGSQFRFVADGLPVEFDDVVPALTHTG